VSSPRDVHREETNRQSSPHTVTAVDVVLVQWPAESARRTQLLAAQVPRLLLVGDEASPPVPDDCLEDWVRVPASEGDIKDRIDALMSRASAHRIGRPEVDEDGVVRHRSDWTSLPPLEARLAAALVERFGAVVSRQTLTRIGWPADPPGRNALDVHVL